MMGFFTSAQLALAVVLGILAIIPAAMILRRRGYSGWWAILTAISPINIIGVWVLAFLKWPLEKGQPVAAR